MFVPKYMKGASTFSMNGQERKPKKELFHMRKFIKGVQGIDVVNTAASQVRTENHHWI
jgi:hypothetical protein